MLIIRHGTTTYNERKLFTGGSDAPLSEKGKDVLRALAGSYPEAELFFTSDLTRTIETLVILYGEVPYIIIPEMRECSFGIYEGKTRDALQDNPALFQAWLHRNTDISFDFPGGESRAAFKKRVHLGLQKICAYPFEKRALLVSHGGVIHAILTLIEPDHTKRVLSIPNAGGLRLYIDEHQSIHRYEVFG